MLKNQVKREGRWTEIPAYLRERARKKKCQVCGYPYGKIRHADNGFVLMREHLDHLIPRRFLEARGINPHQVNVLLSVCCSCHGKKHGLEDRIFQGDLASYLSGLRGLGY